MNGGSSSSIICGELQGVIAKLRQEEYGVSRHISGGPMTKPIFSLREPSVVKTRSIRDVRQVLFTLTGSACKTRDKLRMLISSLELTNAEVDVWTPLQVSRF